MSQVDITPRQLRPIQLIHFALGAGVFVLLIVALLLPGMPVEARPGGEDLLTFLSMVHVVAFFAALGIGRFMFDSQTRREKLEPLLQGSTPDAARDQVLGLIRRVYIIRLALLEAAAFIGLAVVLVAKMTMGSGAVSIYWLNALSAVFFIGFIMFTFPTREKIAGLVS